MLRLWNISLVILTFGLTLFGTFLTRSGVIASVHAFTQGSIGMLFLSFLALVLLTRWAWSRGAGGVPPRRASSIPSCRASPRSSSTTCC